MRLGLAEIAEACGGVVAGAARATRAAGAAGETAPGGAGAPRSTATAGPTIDGVTIDSRAVEPGQLFAAMAGQRDGHDFAAAAVHAGAGAVLVARDVGDLGVAQIRVPDTAAALLDVGRLARRHLPDRVVGITGSVGKTSTKDLMAAVLGRGFPTHASARSFNNELGVPLTLAGAPDGTGAVVVEMGARGPGHIRLLCDVARPTVGVVTVVAGAHLEMFGTLDAVAEAKGELVAALPARGTAVLNADDERVSGMASRAAPGVEVVRFSATGAASADVRATGVRLDDAVRARFVLRTPWGDADVGLAAHGAHHVVNALAAAASGLALGVPVDAVVAALAEAAPSAGRMTLRRTRSGCTVVDDSYNANPTSTRAALAALQALPARRRIAVLGTMAELGDGGPAEHRAIAEEAAAAGVHVIAVAEPAYGVTGRDAVGGWEAAHDRLRDLDVGAGDAVLVKASRVAGLDRLVAVLCA
ncbi:MAG: UDP-N-acetylmuramoyl-tripeptide--D-alanyl-D-alanine ligase [Actinobacteria bacterium]|nr:UDP-N-acetylmuramoyl-tripeptide--D-alanyl-D-alanine ligase [Actinomycetota bacterium]